MSVKYAGIFYACSYSGFVPPCRMVNAPASLLGVEQRERRNHFLFNGLMFKPNMKNTTITAATMPQLYIDRELGEMLLQLQEIRKRFDAYLETHNDPRKITPCEDAFDVEEDLTNAMLGFTKLIACRMADDLFEDQTEADAPAC